MRLISLNLLLFSIATNAAAQTLDLADSGEYEAPVSQQQAPIPLDEPRRFGSAKDSADNLPPPTITAERLIKAAQARRAFQPRDKFDAPPNDASLAGEAFSLLVPVHEIGGRQQKVCGSAPHWSYNPTSSELVVYFRQGTALPIEIAADDEAVLDSFGIAGLVDYWAITCSKNELPSSEGKNAFGVRKTIHRSSEFTVALAGRELPESTGSWTIKLAPDVARRITPKLALRITGVIGEWRPGTPLTCGSYENTPRYDHPWQRSSSTCAFNVHRLKVEILDTSSGGVLIEQGYEPARR